jgi:DNA-binding NarL/FixJ family response regulator
LTDHDPTLAPITNPTRPTPSEVAVLDDAAAGLTIGETAFKRTKSVETVKSQRRSILLKLGARNIAQAVAMTMEQQMAGLAP